jgi:hypothetical protein
MRRMPAEVQINEIQKIIKQFLSNSNVKYSMRKNNYNTLDIIDKSKVSLSKTII